MGKAIKAFTSISQWLVMSFDSCCPSLSVCRCLAILASPNPFQCLLQKVLDVDRSPSTLGQSSIATHSYLLRLNQFSSPHLLNLTRLSELLTQLLCLRLMRSLQSLQPLQTATRRWRTLLSYLPLLLHSPRTQLEKATRLTV